MAKFYVIQQKNNIICIMRTSKEKREKFNTLSGSDQELLLNELLSDYELRSQVL